MIVRSFDIKNINLKKNQIFLLYGSNEGLKNETIEKYFKKKYHERTYYYEENDVINNQESFFSNLLSKSFFDNDKLIIINRTTDKIKDIIDEIVEKNIEDIVLILNSSILEKKSKLRSYFEKNKELICIPFYEDNNQTLSVIANNFFRDKKIPISQQSINLIIERSRGDRMNLNNELEKIGNFIKDNNKIDVKDILKLTNLAENYNVSELIDSCLAKNIKKTTNILNENNYSVEDCILIIRTFLIKSKRLLKISKQTLNNKNIDNIITTFKPPIFWKEKDIVKQQIKGWSYNNILTLIFKINNIELIIKKNSIGSVNIMSDFIIEQATKSSN